MIVRFSGSSDISLNDKDIEIETSFMNIKEVFTHLYNTVTDEYFTQDGTLKDGILCLLDESDWELYDCYECNLEKVNVITLINTLHGG